MIPAVPAASCASDEPYESSPQIITWARKAELQKVSTPLIQEHGHRRKAATSPQPPALPFSLPFLQHLKIQGLPSASPLSQTCHSKARHKPWLSHACRTQAIFTQKAILCPQLLAFRPTYLTTVLDQRGRVAACTRAFHFFCLVSRQNSKSNLSLTKV